MNRRLRNHISPLVQAGLAKASFAIIITATIWISPQALARVNAANAELALGSTADAVINSEHVSSEIYSKDDLSKKAPDAVRGIDTTAREQLGNLLRNMAGAQSDASRGLMGLYNANQVQNDAKHRLAEGSLSDDASTTAKAMDVSNTAKTEVNKALQAQITANIAAYQFLKSGVNFNFDFGSLFSSSGAPVAKKSSSGSLRYGLVLKDIIPDRDAPNHAAVGDMSDEEMLSSAGRADVIWTIGPITENPETEMFHVPPPAADPTNLTPPPATPMGTVTENISKLSGKFKGKVAPATMPDGSAAQTGFKQAPGLALTLTQEQNLYEMYVGTANGVKRTSMEHQFNVPVAGTLSLGRRYNDKMQVIRSSANNILVDKRLPSLSVHYLNMEDRYQAGAAYSGKDYSVSMAADTPRGWGPTSDFGTKAGERYTLNYNKNL